MLGGGQKALHIGKWSNGGRAGLIGSNLTESVRGCSERLKEKGEAWNKERCRKLTRGRDSREKARVGRNGGFSPHRRVGPRWGNERRRLRSQNRGMHRSTFHSGTKKSETGKKGAYTKRKREGLKGKPKWETVWLSLGQGSATEGGNNKSCEGTSGEISPGGGENPQSAGKERAKKGGGSKN